MVTLSVLSDAGKVMAHVVLRRLNSLASLSTQRVSVAFDQANQLLI